MTFELAAKQVNTLSKKPSNEVLLKLYSLYKQGTEGDATSDRPGMLDIKGRAKWDAWNKLKGVSETKAKADYVALVLSLLKSDGK